MVVEVAERSLRVKGRWRWSRRWVREALVRTKMPAWNVRVTYEVATLVETWRRKEWAAQIWIQDAVLTSPGA